MAALIVTGRLVAWHLLAVAVIFGSLVAGHIPARQALTAARVPKRDVTSAFAVHATLMGVMRIAAPQAAGVLLATFGASFCYVMQAAGYLWSVLHHSRVRTPVVESRRSDEGVWRNIAGWCALCRRRSQSPRASDIDGALYGFRVSVYAVSTRDCPRTY